MYETTTENNTKAVFDEMLIISFSQSDSTSKNTRWTGHSTLSKSTFSDWSTIWHVRIYIGMTLRTHPSGIFWRAGSVRRRHNHYKEITSLFCFEYSPTPSWLQMYVFVEGYEWLGLGRTRYIYRWHFLSLRALPHASYAISAIHRTVVDRHSARSHISRSTNCEKKILIRSAADASAANCKSHRRN